MDSERYSNCNLLNQGSEGIEQCSVVFERTTSIAGIVLG